MSDVIYKQDAIDIVEFECGEWTGLAKEIAEQIQQLPSFVKDADCISRKALLDQLDLVDRLYVGDIKVYPESSIRLIVKNLPSAEPEIIHCKDCKRHNLSVEDVWDNPSLKWCPLVAYRGKAQGHEFDYQYCVCAERKTDG